MEQALMAKTLTVYLAADLKKFNAGMDQAGRKAEGLGGVMNKLLGPALIGAGIAAGALATKLAVDGVKAAVEDEAAVAKLAQTMENLGLAHETKPVEDYIYQLERSLGIADTELRPAYDRLVRSIGNTEDANDAMALSLDVAAGTGKSLESVVEALGKAYDGNVTGLQRLGAGLDNATIRTGDMNKITGKLAKTFGGQATTQAKTFAGQLGRLQTAVDNLGEAFGGGILTGLGDTNEATQELVELMESLEPALKRAGEGVGKFVAALAGSDGLQENLETSATNAATLIETAGNLAVVTADATDATQDYVESLPGSNEYSGPIGQAQRLIDTLKVVNYWFGTNEESADDLSVANRDLTSATVDAAIAAGESQSAFEDLTPVLEDNKDTALEAAGSYVKLYEKIADANRIASDFATTSGTVSSAIASGILNPQYTSPKKTRALGDELDKELADIGPESGRSLGLQMLEEGLIPALQEHWVNVVENARLLASELPPDFRETGIMSGTEMVTGLAEQLQAETKTLASLGKKIAKPVGANFKAQLMADVAEAIRAVEASASAARAEKVAQAQAEAARLTEQAVAQAIGRIVSQGDARTGRNVSPVLS
jgi:hypothetical protein